MSHIRYFSLLLVFIYSPCIIGAQKPEIFLCVEKDSGKGTGKKLVYGYIYGVKTECMPQKDFLELYAKKTADIEKANRIDTLSNAEIIQLLQNGEKNLPGAKFQGFDFMDISFKGVNLTKTNFESADLRNASFQNSNCTKTNFSHAFIKNADFRDANLTNADFTGSYCAETDFSSAKGLYPKMFKSAVTLYNAKFNPPLAKKLKKQYPDLFKKPHKCWETNAWLDDSTACDESTNIYKYKKEKNN